MRVLLQLALLGSVASANTLCTSARDAAVPLVRVHAHKDLDCPEKQIHVKREMGGLYRASGCGRTAVYNTACDHLRCTVGLEDEEPAPWRDRPEPGSVEEGR